VQVEEQARRHDTELMKERDKLRAAKEDVGRVKKDAEQAIIKAKASVPRVAATPGTSREAKLEDEVAKCMVCLYFRFMLKAAFNLHVFVL
jgi:hypothetical protein